MVKGMMWFVILFFTLQTSTAIQRIDRRRLDPLLVVQQVSQHRHNATVQRNEGSSSRTVNVDLPDSPDGHLVTDPLPLTKDGEELKTNHWAGHLPASGDQQKYFFYWLFEPETVDDNTPLLIWLNGGPACSSMDGLFLENGPIRWTIVDGKYMLEKNPYSWHHAPAYTLYIDQPVGTGLSFTTNKGWPTNDEEINIDFYYFLTSFLDLHADKFVKDGSVWRPFFFSGESHAGHYIPSMMNYILEKNRNGAQLKIPLAGAAIGNGYFDPLYQYSAAEAAYGHGLVGRAQLNSFLAAEQQCRKGLQNKRVPPVCDALLDDILDQTYGKSSNFRVSSYDVRLSEHKHDQRRFPKGHQVTECYLGGSKIPDYDHEGTMTTHVKDSVLSVIHASAATEAGQIYMECTDPPYDALEGQEGKGVVVDVVQVLQDPSKPRLLFYNGLQDLICNHVGNERALENLPWHGRDDWETAPRYAWFALPQDDHPAGFMKEYDNLMFLKVLRAGHMVPMDLPEVSLEMMRLFLSNKPFSENVQKLSSAAADFPEGCSACDTCPLRNNCTECPSLAPSPAPSQIDCSKEIADAKQETLASIVNSGSGGQDSSIGVAPVAGGILLVLVFLIYGIMEMRKRRQSSSVATTTLELQPRYRDESVDAAEVERRSNGVI